MMLVLGRITEIEAPSSTDPKALMLRAPALIDAAMRLGVSNGCRIRDDAHGLEFVWRWRVS